MNGENIFDMLDGEFGLPVGDYTSKALEQAEYIIKSKFASGRKSNRTAYAKEAFGEHYPSEIEDYSFAVDMFTGVCDDLNDDISMSKQEHSLHMVALADIMYKFFSEFPRDVIDELALHDRIMLYIQTAEHVTINSMKQAENEEGVIGYGVKSYDIRATDMDFFVRLPAKYVFNNDKEIERLVKAGRCFRAMNLLNKDYHDIEHDRKNDTETAVIVLTDRGIEPARFADILMLENRQRMEKLIEGSEDKKGIEIINRFYEMMRSEYEEVKR